jgi:hypothetical protein
LKPNHPARAQRATAPYRHSASTPSPHKFPSPAMFVAQASQHEGGRRPGARRSAGNRGSRAAASGKSELHEVKGHLPHRRLQSHGRRLHGSEAPGSGRHDDRLDPEKPGLHGSFRQTETHGRRLRVSGALDPDAPKTACIKRNPGPTALFVAVTDTVS